MFHLKVAKIREQCQKQEETIREQETELDSKRGELQKLKDEESSLEKEYEENKQKLEKLSKSLQDTQLQICQVGIENIPNLSNYYFSNIMYSLNSVGKGFGNAIRGESTTIERCTCCL